MDIGIRVTRAAASLFRGSTGLPAAVGALANESSVDAPAFHADQVMLANIAAELAEKSVVMRYPLVNLYCERVTNQLREKFRTFSGKVRMVAEARVSHSRLEGIERTSHLLSDAVTEVLDASRGDWGNGIFYTGGYEITYAPVKSGGKNFLQITKIAFEVDVSAD